VTNTQQFKVTVPVEGQMVKSFKPKNNSVDAPVRSQPHVEYQTSSPQSQYIQYDSLHEAMQACLKKQDARANQRRKQRRPDLTCELRCQKSNESTVHLEHCTSETKSPIYRSMQDMFPKSPKTPCGKTRAETIHAI